MTDHQEKRAHPRLVYPVPIEISHIGQGDNVDAQSLNHCEGGMCFESGCAFRPGQALQVRVSVFHPHGPCRGLCEGLRTIATAEVKWCAEVPGSDTPYYRVGVKFFAPVY